MSFRRWAALLAVLLIAAPLPAGFPGAVSGREVAAGAAGARPEDGGTFWLPRGDPGDLPGAAGARAARSWVSGEPLLASGMLRLEQTGGGGEGGAGGRAMELKLSGAHCKIYVDSNAKPYPTNASVQALANEFDGKIWPNDTGTFGNIIYNSINMNIINIDGPWGIGGYFTGADPNSIYMDCADINYWGYQIAAHEMEHLIHNQKDPDEELWVNEGCADLAIAIIYGVNDGTITGHVDGFEGTPDNDLTVFQNEMYDYGSAYAFIQYFWDRFGGQSTVRALVANKANGMAGIEDTLQSLGYADSFSEIFSDWCVANRLDDIGLLDGHYGYAALDIHVNFAGDYPNPPVSQVGDVHRWASDCYRFRGGNALDLLVQLCASKGSYTPRLFGQGQSGTNSTLIDFGLNSTGFGEALLPAFGRDYSEGILFSPSSTGGSYNYSARMVDRTQPVTTATVFPPGPNGQKGFYVLAPTITIRSNEDGARIGYGWDDLPEENYSSPLTAPEGDHTLRYYSIDGWGNRDPDHNLSFRVDTIAPETFMQTSPEGPDGDSGWYITAPVMELSCAENATTLYCWDSGAFTNYTGPITASEGRHRLEFYSVDDAGNEGPTRTADFLLDSKAPLSRANLTPPVPDGLGGWYRTLPKVSLESDEAGTLLLYAWDNSSESAFVGPLTAPEGIHRLRYRSRDAAGNNGTRQELLVRVDTLAPELSVTVEPRFPDGRNGWYRTRPTVTLTIDDADPAASVLYAWDSAGLRPCFGPLKAPEGVHTLRFIAMDTRGNSGNESSKVFRVDSLPPATRVSISPPDQGGEWYRAAPEITLQTDANAEIWYWWDGGPPSLYGAPVSPEEGEHELGFQAKDSAGNTEKARTLIFRTDTAPPVARLALSGTSLGLGDILSADAGASSDYNGIDICSIDFGDGTRKSGADQNWEHQYESAGTYLVVLKVKDQSGTWSDPVEASVTVLEPPRPPARLEQGSALPLPPPVLAGLVLVAIAVAAASFAIRRRRKQSEE